MRYITAWSLTIVLSTSDAQFFSGAVSEPLEGYVDADYHWRRELDEVLKVDVCKNGKTYGKCLEEKFPRCKDDQRICMYRIPRTDICADGPECKDPYYYIDYSNVRCVPIWNEEKGRKWNCNWCEPGKWCPTFKRCVKRKKRFCPDWCGLSTVWCESAKRCLRYKYVGKNRKREYCPDPGWNEKVKEAKIQSQRVSDAYILNPQN